MLALLATKDIVTIAELMAAFDISVETVRRDLSLLEKQGAIVKVYGGARLAETELYETALEKRMREKLPEKTAIAKKCSEFIHDGDCIFIDSGSTTYHIAKQLTAKKNLIIITNSLPVVNELIGSGFEVVVIGGRLRHNEHSVVTHDYLFNFSELNIKKSFICASGITVENGISDFDIQEAATRKKIIERSKEVFVAADSGKFLRDVAIGIAPLDRVDYIVTDWQVPRSVVNEFKQVRTELVVAEEYKV